MTKIKNISKQYYDGKVYNFHCLPDENYYSEGVLVHNCYKDNTVNGRTIELERFKKYALALKILNPFWCQVAFGIGSLSAIDELPEMLKITRGLGVIPNITISAREFDFKLDTASVEFGLNAIGQYCGAVAISDTDMDNVVPLATYLKEVTLTHEGTLAQINVHHVLSNETYDKAFRMIDIVAANPGLINAIVFLWVKPKGRATSGYTPVSQDKLRDLVLYAIEKNVGFGMDSCSANAVAAIPEMQPYLECIEPCESTLFSAYLDVDGKFYPCSFSTDFYDGVHILDIIKHQNLGYLWESNQYRSFRFKCLKNERSCPLYNLCGDKNGLESN